MKRFKLFIIIKDIDPKINQSRTKQIFNFN